MKAKRSLGQNFFINKNLGEHIINIVSENKCKNIVEIGPGMGFFTKYLIERFENTILIEKDTSLVQNLKIQFPKASIVNDDFLDISLEEIIKEDSMFFGSLPFNVSKPIIRKIIESNLFKYPSFFIVQKEVAQKYIYRAPYSSLSLTTALYANTKHILDISRDSFRPKPNVTSSLISFTPRDIKIKDVKGIEELITLSFRQPRKNIKNNLKNTRYLKGSSKYELLRPAQLSLDEYINIYEYSH